MEEEKQKENYEWKNRARPAIYAMAGVYLAYLAYSMFKKIAVTSGGEQILMIIFAILFAIIGTALMLFGVIRGYKYSKASREMTGPDQELEAEPTEPTDDVK